MPDHYHCPCKKVHSDGQYLGQEMPAGGFGINDWQEKSCALDSAEPKRDLPSCSGGGGDFSQRGQARLERQTLHPAQPSPAWDSPPAAHWSLFLADHGISRALCGSSRPVAPVSSSALNKVGWLICFSRAGIQRWAGTQQAALGFILDSHPLMTHQKQLPGLSRGNQHSPCTGGGRGTHRRAVWIWVPLFQRAILEPCGPWNLLLFQAPGREHLLPR